MEHEVPYRDPQILSTKVKNSVAGVNLNSGLTVNWSRFGKELSNRKQMWGSVKNDLSVFHFYLFVSLSWAQLLVSMVF